VSLPLLVRKQVLECRKLDLEILEKEMALRTSAREFQKFQRIKRRKTLALMEWFASWGVCFQMIVLANAITFGFIFRSFLIFLVGTGVSAVLGLVCVYCALELPRKRILQALEEFKDAH
jgi:hypothetical protein